MYILHTHPGLADRIKQLEESREKHAAALAEIDQLLSRISQALKSSSQSTILSEPLDSLTWETGAGNGSKLFGENGHRKYHKMELTGDQAVVAFVRSRGTATTAEINAQWRADGRGGVANNAIVRLLKRGELARQPNPGSRGGRYHSPHDSQRNDGSDASPRVHEPASFSSSTEMHADSRYTPAFHDRA